MVLEWIRRHDPDFSAKLKTYLFTEGSIIERARMPPSPPSAPTAAGPRAHRSLRGRLMMDLPASPHRAHVRPRL